ncbi:divalent-cation tolerance protein CutA [Helicobacter trogontum]|uniref:Divalent-cation tolerance protein CutA n=1 Tax=Helicobacter trogontum TaxID=50960 RepID=A0A4U8S9B6_9HELI|nr:divalent-cation tolerance protein CutA [Helicobacter trogontum]TLD82506.1 divalent-cation tolerance protein CutA [Helicobacter trogontum]
MLIIHTTTPTKKEAKTLIKLLLKSHLIACAQYCKIKSHYIWKDSKGKSKLCKDKEYLIILKTLPKHYKAIESLIHTYHSYEVPEIVFFEAKAEDAYNAWLHTNLS